MDLCSVDDCNRPIKCKGYCSPHYYQQWKHGTTDRPLRVCRPKRPFPKTEEGAKQRKREYYLQAAFKMSWEEAERFLELQNYTCLCGKPLTIFSHVDHDHDCCPSQRENGRRGWSTCGKCTRGFLCNSCNAGTGLLNDDPKLLRALADYLEKK